MSDVNYEKIGRIEDKVIEECAELIKAICKAKRFGWSNYHPKYDLITTRSPKRTNLERVCEECADVLKNTRELLHALAAGYVPKDDREEV